MDTADEYKTLIGGLTPDSEKHLTFVEVEPRTGTPLRASKRAQFNMFVSKVTNRANTIHITFTENYKTALVPILWLDEGIELNNENIDLLNTNLFNLERNIYIGIWVVIGVGIALFIGMMVWYFCRRSQQKKNLV